MTTPSDDKFTPKGIRIPLEELSEYHTDNGVQITRADVEKAIATSDAELKKYLLAGQKKNG